MDPQMGDAQKRISADQPPGFGEFGGGTLVLAFQGIGGGELGVKGRSQRIGAVCFFEPENCLVGARLQ